MTQIRRRIGDYAASRWLNSTDVIGNEGAAVITQVGEQEVDNMRTGGKRLALMVTFDRWPDKALDMNVTNIKVLQDMLGEDVGPDDLRGTRVWVGIHDTRMGKGVLLSPPQDSMQAASADARQRIAAAREAESRPAEPPPLPILILEHSHPFGVACVPASCDVARAIDIGHEVRDSYPELASTHPPVPSSQPPVFVPQNQPPSSTVAPGGYDAQDPGPGANGEEEAPF